MASSWIILFVCSLLTVAAAVGDHGYDTAKATTIKLCAYDPHAAPASFDERGPRLGGAYDGIGRWGHEKPPTALAGCGPGGSAPALVLLLLVPVGRARRRTYGYGCSVSPVASLTHTGYQARPDHGYDVSGRPVCRWPSRDPIEEDGGENIYQFLGNNALSEIDLLGMRPPRATGSYKARIDASLAMIKKRIPWAKFGVTAQLAIVKTQMQDCRTDACRKYAEKYLKDLRKLVVGLHGLERILDGRARKNVDIETAGIFPELGLALFFDGGGFWDMVGDTFLDQGIQLNDGSAGGSGIGSWSGSELDDTLAHELAHLSLKTEHHGIEDTELLGWMEVYTPKGRKCHRMWYLEILGSNAETYGSILSVDGHMAVSNEYREKSKILRLSLDPEKVQDAPF